MKGFNLIFNKDDTTLITFDDMQIKFDTPFFERIRHLELEPREVAWHYYAAHAQWREARNMSSDVVTCPHCGENIAFMFPRDVAHDYSLESFCLFCLQPIEVSTRTSLVANALYRTKPYEPKYEDA